MRYVAMPLTLAAYTLMLFGAAVVGVAIAGIWLATRVGGKKADWLSVLSDQEPEPR